MNAFEALGWFEPQAYLAQLRRERRIHIAHSDEKCMVVFCSGRIGVDLSSWVILSNHAPLNPLWWVSIPRSTSVLAANLAETYGRKKALEIISNTYPGYTPSQGKKTPQVVRLKLK